MKKLTPPLYCLLVLVAIGLIGCSSSQKLNNVYFDNDCNTSPQVLGGLGCVVKTKPPSLQERIGRWICKMASCVSVDLVSESKSLIMIKNNSINEKDLNAIFFLEIEKILSGDPFHAVVDENSMNQKSFRKYRSRYQRSKIASPILFEDVSYIVTMDTEFTRVDKDTRSAAVNFSLQLAVEVSASNVAEKYHAPDKVTYERYASLFQAAVQRAKISGARSIPQI
jgi:hypothetical protein